MSDAPAKPPPNSLLGVAAYLSFVEQVKQRVAQHLDLTRLAMTRVDRHAAVHR
jgi:hypothetical protein